MAGNRLPGRLRLFLPRIKGDLFKQREYLNDLRSFSNSLTNRKLTAWAWCFGLKNSALSCQSNK